jgi:hypothetical protein
MSDFRVGEAVIDDRVLWVTSTPEGPFDLSFVIWEGEPRNSPVLGDGRLELILPADILSNLPEHWIGKARYGGSHWRVEGTPHKMLLFDEGFT